MASKIQYGTNGVSEVMATKEDGRIKLFISEFNDGGMKEVGYTEFMAHFRALAFVAVTSWNNKLAAEYKEFYDTLQKWYRRGV